MITKAAVLRELNEPLVIETLKIPELNPGQVLIKVLYSGVCRSQINEIKGNKGDDKYLPHTLGHEASAMVEDIGPNVNKVKKGDYVVLSWIKGEGMDVPSCRYLKEDGAIVNSGAATSFSEYSVVSENRLAIIPDDISPEVGALLGCAVPTGIGIIKNELHAKENESIVIFGVGGIGFSALLGAVMFGMNPVIAVDINEEKLQYAKSCGATHVINSSITRDVIGRIREICAEGTDYSVDCTGVAKIFETAFEAIKNSGTALLAGNAKKGDKISITPFDLILGKKIIGTWGGATNLEEDLHFYAKQFRLGKLPLNQLISETFELGEINQAIAALEQGKLIRALIKVSEK